MIEESVWQDNVLKIVFAAFKRWIYTNVFFLLLFHNLVQSRQGAAVV